MFQVVLQGRVLTVHRMDVVRQSRISDELYHRLQIDFAYDSNHIEGSRLTHEQTRWIVGTKTVGNVGSDLAVLLPRDS